MLEAYGLYTHIRSNRIKTAIVLTIFPFLLPIIVLCVGLAIGAVGKQPANQVIAASAAYSIMVGFVVVPLMVLWVPIGYFINQWIIDRATGARGITRQEEMRVWNLLENLCISRGMTTPALRIIETLELNAYASGVTAKSYSVTLTRGLIESLDDQELECVIAHELTHIRNNDVQLLVVTSIIAGVAPLSCDIILLMWRGFMWAMFLPFRLIGALLPGLGGQIRAFQGIQNLCVTLCAICLRVLSEFFSLVLSLFVSRKREFMADAGAIELTKNPEAMISALRKVSENSDVPTTVAAVRQMYFDNPHMHGIGGLFSTHPSVEKRIEAIVRYAQKYGSSVAPVARTSLEKIAVSVAPAPRRRFGVDYEAFLRRQLEKLGEQTKESRQELYERIASALSAQLNKVTPVITEQEWQIEQRAFGDALRNVEEAAQKLDRPRPPVDSHLDITSLQVSRSERW